MTTDEDVNEDAATGAKPRPEIYENNMQQKTGHVFVSFINNTPPPQHTYRLYIVPCEADVKIKTK